MMENYEIRAQAKALYKLYFTKLFIAYTLCYIIFWCALYLVSYIKPYFNKLGMIALLFLAVLPSFVIAPFSIGLCRMLLNLWHGQKASVKDILCIFQSKKFFYGALGLALFQVFIHFLNNLTLDGPAILISFFYRGTHAFSAYTRLKLLGYVFYFIIIWIMLRTTLSHYLFVNHFSESAIMNIKESWKKMKGHAAQLFYLYVSLTWHISFFAIFVFLLLLESMPYTVIRFLNSPFKLFITFYIPYILLYPYIQLSVTGLMSEVLNEKKDMPLEETEQLETEAYSAGDDLHD